MGIWTMTATVEKMKPSKQFNHHFYFPMRALIGQCTVCRSHAAIAKRAWPICLFRSFNWSLAHSRLKLDECPIKTRDIQIVSNNKIKRARTRSMNYTSTTNKHSNLYAFMRISSRASCVYTHIPWMCMFACACVLTKWPLQPDSRPHRVLVIL